MSQRRIGSLRWDQVLEANTLLMKHKSHSSAYHLRSLVLYLNYQLEQYRNYAANQVCDGVIDFLGMLFKEFELIQARFYKDQDLREHLSLILHLIQAVNNQLLNMRDEFWPEFLDKFGLVKALESKICHLSNKVNTVSQVDISDRNLKFNKNFEIVLFRVIEQAFSNIEKHAQTSEIVFAYGVSDCNKLIVEIRDNGMGIPQEKLHDPNSIGLILMSEQVTMLGGEIDIIPMTQSGTLILISIPEAYWTSQLICVEQAN